MKVIIHGVNGSMGQVLAKTALNDPTIEVVAGVDLHADQIEHPFPVYTSLAKCTEIADVVIDFSVYQAVSGLLEDAIEKQLPVVIATTGLSNPTLELISHAAKRIPIFQAANMSVGVNLMYELAQNAAAVLGNTFDIEIIERHHNKKIDAPSGTAYAIANAINKVFQGKKDFVFGRYGKNEKRETSDIGIHAVRGGTIAGEHTVVFAGQEEVLELKHSALSKQIFAAGALHAGHFLYKKPNGFYTMQDIMTEAATISSIYSDDNQSMITLLNLPLDDEITWQVFDALGKANINLDMVSQSAPINPVKDLSFTLAASDLNRALSLIDAVIKQSGLPIETRVLYETTKLTVEGVGMEFQSGVTARFLKAMSSRHIEIKSISTSEIKISCIIERQNKELAVSALKSAFNI
jgi:4-hydroxy-tetrahydrodipicolinate reductase